MPQAVTPAKRSIALYAMGLTDEEQAEGHLVMRRTTIGCANPDCLKTTIHAAIAPGIYHNGSYRITKEAEAVFDQYLRPQGTAKPQPEYIP